MLRTTRSIATIAILVATVAVTLAAPNALAGVDRGIGVAPLELAQSLEHNPYAHNDVRYRLADARQQHDVARPDDTGGVEWQVVTGACAAVLLLGAGAATARRRSLATKRA